MTIELSLPSDTEAQIRQYVATSGLDVKAFILQAVAEKLADADLQSVRSARPVTDWAARLRECIDLHPVASHFVDDSRQSIYAGRGE